MKSEKERRQKMKEGGGKKREKSTRKQNIWEERRGCFFVETNT
jgi:hypothetical protein